ncbi:helix-turn-helix domain-containing protein [Lacticaseibacillus yichunensis]|uniref:Helix-turn-helix domain-containing protein n=1 Tax=Lacticaseibacillus yichunensis TaxID=2486015 RepID=A0ABW4CP24_9LACO|nr:helix-turn-helix domain-containing protein [Lacticaseibacillus yichunensis]
MFESYFFDKRAMINYRVFRVMKALEDTNFTVNRLSAETQLSYSQAYNAYQDILNGLARLSGQPADATAEFSTLSAGVTVDRYRFQLLQDSMAFQFYDYAFRTQTPNVHDFCKNRDYSISTLRRRIDPFKTYLQSLGLSLNASTWALEGDELQIRLAMLTFFQLAYRGAGWPFASQNLQVVQGLYQSISEDASQQWFPAPRTATKQILLTLAICWMRIQFGHVLPPKAKLTKLFADKDARPLPMVFTSERFPELNAVALTTECAAYYFLRLHFLTIEDTPDALDNWMIDQFDEKTDPVGAFAAGLINTLQTHELAFRPDAPTRDHTVLRANLLRCAFTFLVLQGGFSKRLDFYPEQMTGNARGQLRTLVDQYFTMLRLDEPAGVFITYQADMVSLLCDIVAADFPGLNADHQLTVTVLIEPGTFATRDLMSFLERIHFVTIKLPDAAQPPDVVITTLTSDIVVKHFYTPARLKNTQVIGWHNEAGDNDFFSLYSALCDAHDQRLKLLSE